MSQRARARVAIAVVLVVAIGCHRDRDRGRDDDGSAPPAIQFFHREFLAREGVPVYEDWGIADVNALELRPWARVGGRGAYLRLHGQEGLVGAWVLELAPGERTKAERHVFDEIVYVLSGSGTSRVWQDAPDGAATIDWHTGSLFAPPLNAWHAHENTGTAPARLIGFSNAPLVLDFFRNERFVFENPFVFRDRWDGDVALFAPGPVIERGVPLPRGNALDPFTVAFVPDVRSLDPVMHPWKDKNGDFVSFAMAGNLLNAHVSTWPAGSYQTAHRHAAGASVLIVAGEGYHLMWPAAAGAAPYRDGHADSVIRLDFRPGSVFSPPDDWYHMHMNSGADRAIYLAVTPEGRRDRAQFIRRPEHHPAVNAVEGPLTDAIPLLIPSDKEDPAIRAMFDDDVARRRCAQ